MVASYSKKRKVEEGMNGRTRPKKKFRKQKAYHSSSEDEEQSDVDEFPAINLQDSDAEDEVLEAPPPEKTKSKPAKKSNARDQSSDEEPEEEEEEEDDGDEASESGSDAESASDDNSGKPTKRKNVSKRNDPAAFSTSISKILSTKLPTSARADPVLSRSKSAAQATSDLANEKLENRARAKLRSDKREDLDRGRVRDVLGVERGEAGATAEEEKKLRKIAQRGVIKLFNAVRAAQVRGEEAAKAERKKGTVGMGEREKAVNEVSKQSFLELINGKKGTGGKELNIEEA